MRHLAAASDRNSACSYLQTASGHKISLDSHKPERGKVGGKSYGIWDCTYLRLHSLIEVKEEKEHGDDSRIALVPNWQYIGTEDKLRFGVQ